MQVCPPSGVAPASDCYIPPSAGHFNRTAGIYAAATSFNTDSAWWESPPGDLPPGAYKLDIAVCDGSCLHAKPRVILAETTSTFTVHS